jgi:hypothetical protein
MLVFLVLSSSMLSNTMPFDCSWPTLDQILGNNTLRSKGTITFRLDGHSEQKYFPFVSAPGLLDILWCYMVFCSPPSITCSHLPIVQSFMLYYYSCYGLWRSMTAVRQMLAGSAEPFVAPSVIIAQFPSQENRIWKGGRGIVSVLADWLINDGTIKQSNSNEWVTFFSG